MTIKNNFPPIHPGEFLSEILEDAKVSQSELARRIGVSRMRISYIINGKRPVTAEMAHLFGKVFRQTPEYWLNLQRDYDLKVSAAHIKKQLSLIQPIV